MKPVGLAVSQDEVDSTREAYHHSCLRLAQHFLYAKVGAILSNSSVIFQN
jgi:hypothetical protein